MNTDTFMQLARQMLKTDEGSISRPYDDKTNQIIKAPLGNVTIGVGHNCDKKPLPQVIIDSLLDLDIHDAALAAVEVVGYDFFQTLSINRQLALVNLAFNLGAGGLASFHKFLAALKVYNYDDAAKEIQSSLWSRQVDPRQVPSQGRDYRVIKLIKDDVYVY